MSFINPGGGNDYEDEDRVMIKLTSSGSWSLYSESDPCWNASGSCDVGGFVMPEPCRVKLEELKALYGKPPADLEWSYMKD